MVACSVVMVPGEVIKTRMQAGMVKNLIEGVTQTLKQDGIGGLFAGYYATLVRDVPYTMLELGLYENIKVRLLSQYLPLCLSLTNLVLFLSGRGAWHPGEEGFDAAGRAGGGGGHRGHHVVPHHAARPHQDQADDAKHQRRRPGTN